MSVSFYLLNNSRKRSQNHRGAVLMVMLVILVVGASVLLLSSLNSTAIRIERDQITDDAMAKAKEALIGYSAMDSTPGQLPCPEDITLIGSPNEGRAMSSCSNTLTVIGRLPWRTLGLGDLRDGNGEKLWYVFSPGFRSSSINSDTQAQLAVDAIPNSAVAVIFSAGPPINGQSRPTPTLATPPVITQYLELSNNDGDNTFISNGPSNAFNDRPLIMTHNDLFRVVEKRVAGEVKQCLNSFAADNLPINGIGLYPWATPETDLTFTDTTGTLFGRIPDTPFTNSESDNGTLSNSWDAAPACTIISGSGWWLNWKEMVFYGLANAYAPIPSLGNLTVNPPSLIADKKFVVIVSGKMLPGQIRTSPADKSTLNNYLEAPNNVGVSPFAQNKTSATFNDTVVFQ